mmetsp:Transcript_26060/g.65808  ORF Transcript_26060/g.65808 Transcript_26060/m.65808 type:complete len:469 (-) Transcript_26060:58-1464(-)
MIEHTNRRDRHRQPPKGAARVPGRRAAAPQSTPPGKNSAPRKNGPAQRTPPRGALVPPRAKERNDGGREGDEDRGGARGRGARQGVAVVVLGLPGADLLLGDRHAGVVVLEGRVDGGGGDGHLAGGSEHVTDSLGVRGDHLGVDGVAKDVSLGEDGKVGDIAGGEVHHHALGAVGVAEAALDQGDRHEGDEVGGGLDELGLVERVRLGVALGRVEGGGEGVGDLGAGAEVLAARLGERLGHVAVLAADPVGPRGVNLGTHRLLNRHRAVRGLLGGGVDLFRHGDGGGELADRVEPRVVVGGALLGDLGTSDVTRARGLEKVVTLVVERGGDHDVSVVGAPRHDAARLADGGGVAGDGVGAPVAGVGLDDRDGRVAGHLDGEGVCLVAHHGGELLERLGARVATVGVLLLGEVEVDGVLADSVHETLLVEVDLGGHRKVTDGGVAVECRVDLGICGTDERECDHRSPHG